MLVFSFRRSWLYKKTSRILTDIEKHGVLGRMKWLKIRVMQSFMFTFETVQNWNIL